MNKSLNKIDRLEFSWDNESSQKLNLQNQNLKKTTSSTEVHLEEYFAFLEDVLPPSKPQKNTFPHINKVFELD